MERNEADKAVVHRPMVPKIGDQDAASLEVVSASTPTPEPHVEKWPRPIRVAVLVGLAIVCWIIVLEVI
jgi:hypothetical protein